MKFFLLALIAVSASAAQGAITWTLDQAANPSADQTEAWHKIEAAMKVAVARYAKLGSASKAVKVYYALGVPTAEAGVSGDLRFGSDRMFMNERTALHEISHTLGVGQTTAFSSMCPSGDWKTALPLLKSWDGDDAKISCGGSLPGRTVSIMTTNGARRLQIVMSKSSTP